jgi:2-methylcitrate dehydratase PrpD
VLLNAYQIHCQEFDCLHEGAVLHAMATLLPVLLAEAQLRGDVSGKAFLAAVAAGVDVACTIGLASKQGLRFFRPATSGGFGAVATTCPAGLRLSNGSYVRTLLLAIVFGLTISNHSLVSISLLQFVLSL